MILTTNNFHTLESMYKPKVYTKAWLIFRGIFGWLLSVSNSVWQISFWTEMGQSWTFLHSYHFNSHYTSKISNLQRVLFSTLKNKFFGYDGLLTTIAVWQTMTQWDGSYNDKFRNQFMTWTKRRSINVSFNHARTDHLVKLCISCSRISIANIHCVWSHTFDPSSFLKVT